MARPIFIATRGSALALAQTNIILARCREAFPKLQFEPKIIKTTGDKLQTASMAQEGRSLPKGLFTKELEVALLEKQADLAVHSLKDLPTELPDGLKLGAVGGEREDVRDVLICRNSNYFNRQANGQTKPAGGSGRCFAAGIHVKDFPDGAIVATSSTRRKAQLLSANPGLQVPDIRGNVGTRMRKILDNPELDATVLALAGIRRLKMRVTAEGKLEGDGVPEGLLASVLDTEVMLPAVGQGAIGIEVRENDELLSEICGKLNDSATFQCVTAERAFLAGMGGGCQSPVAAYAEVMGGNLRMRAISFRDGPIRRAEAVRPSGEAVALGHFLATELSK